MHPVGGHSLAGACSVSRTRQQEDSSLHQGMLPGSQRPAPRCWRTRCTFAVGNLCAMFTIVPFRNATSPGPAAGRHDGCVRRLGVRHGACKTGSHLMHRRLPPRPGPRAAIRPSL